MLPPDFWDYAADDVLELYSTLGESIMRDIVRRLVKTGRVTATAGWQIQMAQEAGLLYNDIVSEAARLSDATESHVSALFEEAGIQSTAIDNAVYEAAGMSPPPLRMSPAVMQVLFSGARKTSGHLRNLTMTTALEAQRAYIQAATLAEMQVESGAFDYATAIRNAVKNAASGGTYVQYPTGHRDRLDVAIRRAVLTGVGQTTGQISLQNAQEMGCDLMEITAHAGARPSHSVWQGRVVSLSGRSGYLSLSDIGYNTGPGFKGWNCRHDWYPFFEGLSETAYPRAVLDEYNNRTVEYEGKTISYYEATQKQRAMERSIRDSKRELAGLDEAVKSSSGALKTGLKSDFDAASVKLKAREAQMRDFLHQTGLQKDSNRVQVAGFGRSQAQKAVWANKRVANAASGGILNETDIYAINQYMSGKSYALNDALRRGKTLSDSDLRLVLDIDAAISKLPEFKGTVYRSISSDMILDMDAFRAAHAAGKRVCYSAYTSASTNIYDDSFDIQMVIESKHGRDMRKLNAMEQEILFTRDTMFEILKVEGNTIWMVDI